MFSQQALTVCTQQEESIKVQNKSFSLLHPCNKCVHYTFLLETKRRGNVILILNQQQKTIYHYSRLHSGFTYYFQAYHYMNI